MDFTVPADHKVKLKENEKSDKYEDLAKKNWNMEVMVILIVIGAVVTATKGLVQEVEALEIRWRVETIQTPALLRLARIQRRVLETGGEPSGNVGVGWLVCWVLWHINRCRLFNTKSIFM